MRRYRYKQTSICILYCAMLGGGACRPRGWNRWCQRCMAGVSVLRTYSTVRLEGERSAFNESEGVLLHCAPLTRLLAQQCFRQRKCREGLAAPCNLLTTCLSRSQWWFLDQSFAPVDHFLLLSQQGVSGRRLSFRLLNRSPFARFSFSLFVSAHLAISIMLWAAMFSCLAPSLPHPLALGESLETCTHPSQSLKGRNPLFT
ncbi:hypothetical protein J3E68DRAFT_87841 [Trichoderma sp. SZMC 28012]